RRACSKCSVVNFITRFRRPRRYRHGPAIKPCAPVTSPRSGSRACCEGGAREGAPNLWASTSAARKPCKVRGPRAARRKGVPSPPRRDTIRRRTGRGRRVRRTGCRAKRLSPRPAGRGGDRRESPASRGTRHRQGTPQASSPLSSGTSLSTPPTLGGTARLDPVLTYKLPEKRGAVRDALARLTPGFAEPPVRGPDECVLAAQDAAPAQDGRPVAPHAVANLLDHLRSKPAHYDLSGALAAAPLTHDADRESVAVKILRRVRRRRDSDSS